MREIVIEEKGTARFESTGWLARKMAYLGRRNSPDHWYLKGGLWCVVEYKVLGEVPTLAQQKEHNRLRDHGQQVYVIDSVERAYALHEHMEAKLAMARAA